VSKIGRHPASKLAACRRQQPPVPCPRQRVLPTARAPAAQAPAAAVGKSRSPPFPPQKECTAPAAAARVRVTRAASGLTGGRGGRAPTDPRHNVLRWRAHRRRRLGTRRRAALDTERLSGRHSDRFGSRHGEAKEACGPGKSGQQPEKDNRVELRHARGYSAGGGLVL